MVVDGRLHFAQMDAVFGIVGNYAGLDVEVGAGFQSGYLAGFADNQVRSVDSALLYFVLAVAVDCHNDGLGAAGVQGTARMAGLVFETNELGTYGYDFEFHLLDEGES